MLLLLLATSPWGLSELWGGRVPTSYIDHYVPRFHRLFLRSLFIGPTPPSPSAVRFPSSPSLVFCLPPPPPAQDYPSTWASLVSVPTYRQPVFLSSFTHQYPRPHPPLTPLDPATSVGITLPPLPRFWMNIFQLGLHLLFCNFLPPPRLAKLPPTIVSRLPCTDLKYSPKGHPLRYRPLPLIGIFPHWFSCGHLKHLIRLILCLSLVP